MALHIVKECHGLLDDFHVHLRRVDEVEGLSMPDSYTEVWDIKAGNGGDNGYYVAVVYAPLQIDIVLRCVTQSRFGYIGRG